MTSSEEISDSVLQAREFALMGNYEDAKIYYSGAVQGVQQMMKQSYELDKKQKWREVHIVYLYSTCIDCTACGAKEAIAPTLVCYKVQGVRQGHRI